MYLHNNNLIINMYIYKYKYITKLYIQHITYHLILFIYNDY